MDARLTTNRLLMFLKDINLRCCGRPFVESIGTVSSCFNRILLDNVKQHFLKEHCATFTSGKNVLTPRASENECPTGNWTPYLV
ncbi:hypothetical protein TNCT_178151 [Trichonephila clavata]|uniref:Uncharacterized protein n=1 Tax=Trichonephila clavata TaxID=2740835 RepID=A0A8X6JXC8_TRICU|nr:hypothetical protein TNCT_178151 [Trichonephila clavata]